MPADNTTSRGIQFPQAKKDTSKYFLYQKPFLSALTSSVVLIIQHILLQCIVVGKLITGQLSINVLSGPVEILTFSYAISSQQLIALWLRWIAAINISLAFINILPIPILDGGQWLLLTIQTLLGRQLPHYLLEALTLSSVFFIGFIFSYVTYHEIINLFIN